MSSATIPRSALVKRVGNDSTHVDSAISAGEKGEQWPQALGLLAELRNVSMPPDIIT